MLARSDELGSWVSIDDHMPEHNEQVWVAFEDHGQGYAIWTGKDWFLDLKESGDLYLRQQAIRDGFEALPITHWHKIPKRPIAEA